ncbi:Na+/melibiose symporter-like transporter [Rathayibacter sp. PhB93]|uniref:MFS transporter n=1 Tax=unclassified Rathayibacter TaxID=2609250 RepID=UPI000F4ABFEC|nr:MULTISPECIES: MFS transporter [unclassified Rathayibacter]ROQ00937.1 Na+/melibiose symporter-like transporter [Rathayibacter sp. PhB93]TDQ07291.1 Na+/melibiose symporter-like transporter [Rathayibacter sp. PhB1]
MTGKSSDGASSPSAPDPRFDELPLNQPATIQVGAERITDAMAGDADAKLPKLRAGYLLAIYFAQLTLYVAFIVPIAFSLAIRVAQVAPDNRDAVLAIAVGLPGLFVVLGTPLVGIFSDRTRSRFGRRRPWLLFGSLLGLLGSAAIALIDGVPGLVIGWCVAYTGYGIVSSMLNTHLGDSLPALQRGRVMGILGAITQIAPILGITVAGGFVESPIGLFLLPAGIAFVGGVFFTLVMRDPQVTGERPPLNLGKVFQGFYFNPRRYPNLAWVWISKALVFLAISMSGLYGVYLLTSRLGLAPAEVGALLAAIGIPGVVAGILGAVGSGYLSDKLKTRKPFLIFSAVTLGASMIVTGTATTIPQYVIGGLILALSIGCYGAVDQALALDVLPRDTDENGRFLAIIGIGSTLPQAIGPFIAGLVLALGSGDYTVVYIAGAAIAVLGAVAIAPITAGRRADLATHSIKVMD